MTTKMQKNLPAAPSLSRRGARQTAKPKIIIFCEGATEEHYLKKLRSEVGSRMVEIEPIGQVGVPETVVAEAVDRLAQLNAIARKKSSDSFDSLFTVWAMFDKDDFEVNGPKMTAHNAGVRVAYSNPCFELWGILHLEDCDAACDRHQAQRRLRQIMPPYHHDDNPYFNYDVMTPDARDNARRRAHAMRKRRAEEQAAEGSPFTSVCDLVEQILTAVGSLQPITTAIKDVEQQIAIIQASDHVNTSGSQSNLSRLFNTLKQLKSH